MSERELPPDQVRRMTRRAFGVFALGGLAAAGGWWWLRRQPTDDNIPWLLRANHRMNERLGRALFSPRNLAPEFPADRVEPEPRVNGHIGQPAAAPAKWQVTVEGPGLRPQSFAPAELLAGLPRVTSITELKCIEGWSQVVSWGGVRFADAAAKHGWPVTAGYVGLETATGAYQVGLDMPSALHPQTLLCDTMNGEPLAFDHGAPLRLVIPVKYGIKNLKWLARVRFSDERPPDYWASRGYDWYSGL
jgi:DMSO/TMAO reductase YedYZ molybdopterin-dependent catalytic subunit